MTPRPQPHSAAAPIMVIDDDPQLREFVALALNEQGYRTITAGDGMEAMALFERELPALVLVDVGMPALGGREFANRVHELWGDRVTCVIMSGSPPSPEDQADSTVASYLAKPFDLDDLFRVVDEYARPSERMPAS